MHMTFVDHLAKGVMAQHRMQEGRTMAAAGRIVGVNMAERIGAFGEFVKAQLQRDGEEIFVLAKLRLLPYVVHRQLGEPLYLSRREDQYLPQHTEHLEQGCSGADARAYCLYERLQLCLGGERKSPGRQGHVMIVLLQQIEESADIVAEARDKAGIRL